MGSFPLLIGFARPLPRPFDSDDSAQGMGVWGCERWVIVAEDYSVFVFYLEVVEERDYAEDGYAGAFGD